MNVSDSEQHPHPGSQANANRPSPRFAGEGKEVDVIVVGGGGSGLAAAIEARALGRDVLLLEKNDQLGGSTAWSVGSVTASGTPHQARQGIQDSAEEHWRDMAGFNGDLDPRDNAGLRRVLADAMPDTFRWLLAHGVRFYGPMPEPPHSKPRMHNVLPNSRSFITHLEKSARRAGVDIKCGVRACALVTEDGCVTAIDCDNRARPASLSRARRHRAGDRRLHQRPGIEGAVHGAAGGQDRRRQRHRDRRRAEAGAGARRPHHQRRSGAGPGIAFRAADAAEHSAEPAALAAARQPDGLVAGENAERAVAAFRDELRHHGAGAVARSVHRRRDPDQPPRRALRR